MRRPRPWIGFTLALAIMAAPAASAPPRSLAERLARFPRVAAATATFAQEREVTLVEDTLRAHGHLAVIAPDTMRLALVDPERVTILVRGRQVRVLDAEEKEVALPPELSGVARFARTLTALLLGGTSPAEFDERWRGDDHVTLSPRDDTGPFASISMRFPPDAPLPTEIVLRERQGDRTTIRLASVETRTEAPPEATP